jgi:hypothetical protein
VESEALSRDHSSFLHCAQVRLLLPPPCLLAFNTWSSHSHGLPLWLSRSFVSNPFDIPPWNWKVDEYIVAVFDFAEKFLAFDGDVLLVHPDDLKVLKEIRSYVESYGFQIWMKWVVVNSLPLMNSEDPFQKVHHNPISFHWIIIIFFLKLKFVF